METNQTLLSREIIHSFYISRHLNETYNWAWKQFPIQPQDTIIVPQGKEMKSSNKSGLVILLGACSNMVGTDENNPITILTGTRGMENTPSNWWKNFSLVKEWVLRVSMSIIKDFLSMYTTTFIELMNMEHKLRSMIKNLVVIRRPFSCLNFLSATYLSSNRVDLL